MNPSAKASYDKINQYRQKIKQTLISQQGGTTHQPPRQQRSHKDQSQYPKITSSLSRSNIRKSPSDVLNLTGNLQHEGHRMQEDPRKNAPSRIVENVRIEDRVQRSRIDQRSRVEEKTRVDGKGRVQDKTRVYENQNRVMTEHSRLEVPPKTAEYIKSSQLRTTQKPSTSKSPAGKPNPYMQQLQTINKRKNSVKEMERSTPKISNSTLYDKTPTFNNLSAFDTFSPRIPLTTGLPPLFGRISSSSLTAEHQVKVLLEENQILSLHLNEKMEKIKSLQKELKAIVKSELLHEEKYDIEMSQLNSEKSMIKKSSDEQVKTLVMQVKKLNDEMVEKEQHWQQRVNMIRKTNLEEQQQTRKNHMKIQEKYKTELQELKIKLATANQDLKTSKQTSALSIQNLKTELANLNQSNQKIAHIHKMQKSSQALQHDQQIKTLKQELYTKIQLLNLDKIRKQNQLNSIIDSLTKQLKKLNHQIEDLKHQNQFNQAKEMEQNGKIILQIRSQKQKHQRLKQQENIKLQKLSQAELQATSQAYQQQISELQLNIINLESLLETRAQQVANLYKQIGEMRKSYQNELNQRDHHISSLHKKLQELNRQFIEQQQCFKIKLAEITQANQQTLKQIYENKISQQQHLLMDKEQIISKLRQRIVAKCMQTSEVNELHQKEVREYLLRIEGLEQQMTSNVLKERNTNASVDKENIILKDNLLRQSESYQKVALVKEENINRLKKMIETKDGEISELEDKIERMKKAHKEEIRLISEQHSLILREKEDAIAEVKEQLDYAKREQSKRAEQFLNDKQYFSNQLREIKSCKDSEFNSCLETLSSQMNDLKIENEDLKMKLSKVSNEYQEYQKLWNEEESLNKLLAKEKEFIEKMNETFTVKTQKMIQFYENDIEENYKPKIASLQELIVEKDEQILDMKGNYHQLEMKFEKFMEEKEVFSEISEKVFMLGRSNDALAKNFVIPGK